MYGEGAKIVETGCIQSQRLQQSSADSWEGFALLGFTATWEPSWFTKSHFMALSDSRGRAQDPFCACSGWARAGRGEAGSHGSGLHGEALSLLQRQLFLLSVSARASLLASLQCENSIRRRNGRTRSCCVFLFIHRNLIPVFKKGG